MEWSRKIKRTSVKQFDQGPEFSVALRHCLGTFAPTRPPTAKISFSLSESLFHPRLELFSPLSLHLFPSFFLPSTSFLTPPSPTPPLTPPPPPPHLRYPECGVPHSTQVPYRHGKKGCACHIDPATPLTEAASSTFKDKVFACAQHWVSYQEATLPGHCNVSGGTKLGHEKEP